MSGFHLAGIVPVAGQPLDFNMPWHDCLMPIAQSGLGPSSFFVRKERIPQADSYPLCPNSSS